MHRCQGAKEVEVFSWWTGGGEAAGLEAMIADFDTKNPDITFIDSAIAGGAGTNARAVLATRLQAGDPPNSWQAHAGQEIIGTYVAADQIEPLNDLFEERAGSRSCRRPHPADLGQWQHLLGPGQHPPRQCHVDNPALLDELGVSVPTTWDEFLAACEPIEAAGKICLGMGTTWTAMHLMEVVLLGELGADGYAASVGRLGRLGQP